MENKGDKRARIIAAQLEREEADRAAGRVPPLPEARSNWAASTPPKRGRKAGAQRKPGRPGRAWK